MCNLHFLNSLVCWQQLLCFNATNGQLFVENGPEYAAIARAAWNGHIEVVRLLIDAGSQLSGTDDKGNSALDYAEQGGHREIARILKAFGA